MWKLCIKHKRLFILGLTFIALTSFIQISFEFLKGAIVETAFNRDLSSLFKFSGVYIFAFIAKAYTHYLYTRFYFLGKNSVIRDLRDTFTNRLLRFTYPVFTRLGRGEYLHKYTEEIDMIDKGLFQSWFGLFQIIFEVIFAFAALIYINKKLAAISFVLLLFPLVFPKFMEQYLGRYQKQYIAKNSEHMVLIVEQVRNFETIKNFASVKNFRQLFDEDNRELFKVNIKNMIFNSFSQNLSKLFAQIGTLGIIGVSAYLITTGELTVGALVISVGLMEELQSQVIYVSGYVQKLLVTKVPVKSMEDFLDKDADEVKASEKSLTLQNVNDISFENVKFCYPSKKEPIFENISLSTDKKGLHLIQGESGCGKSTLMNLLLNYYNPVGGKIFINDNFVDEISNLMDLITIFRQEAVFFEDTLRNNLTLYKDIEDEKVIEILKKLRLYNLANEDVLDEIVIKNGAKFSGGEARRLNLARALLRKSEILILDEPFANIDEEGVNTIAEIISQINDRFVFLITHQLPSKVELEFNEKIYL